jgi:hypothetical protein
VLPFNSSGNIFNPVIDLRIKSSGDQPIQYFGQNGELVEVESEGGWLRFCVEHTTIDLLEIL